MEMIAVKSSMLARIGYDAETKKVHVEYQNGSTYALLDVPAEKFEEFKNAKSVGQYYNAELKGKYTSERVGAGGLGKVRQ